MCEPGVRKDCYYNDRLGQWIYIEIQDKKDRQFFKKFVGQEEIKSDAIEPEVFYPEKE